MSQMLLLPQLQRCDYFQLFALFVLTPAAVLLYLIVCYGRLNSHACKAALWHYPTQILQVNQFLLVMLYQLGNKVQTCSSKGSKSRPDGKSLLTAVMIKLRKVYCQHAKGK